MPRYILTIAYDGTDFCGWQKQEPHAPGAEFDSSSGEAIYTKSSAANATAPAGPAASKVVEALPLREGEDVQRVALRTVQHVVERAVREVVREPVLLHGASRTDAGVHALGQVAAFTCSGGPDTGWPAARGVDRLVRTLNGKLPEDVLVLDAKEVREEFNPIRDCERKSYSYTIHTGRVRPLFERRMRHWVYESLDVVAMQAAGKVIEGEHDFAAFAAAGHGRISTVRTVYECSVVASTPDTVRITCVGNGFLYNMVRIIAGTLVEVGRGRMTAAQVEAALAGNDRRVAGPTLPATGLCLEWIRYRDTTA